MARLSRIEFPGAIYHVTVRMIGSRQRTPEKLFRDDRDYARFMERLGQGIGDFGVRLYLFCLMRNHFHLVLETPQANLSRFMQRLTTAYTVYFNLRHQRPGPLLDGRYKAKAVSGGDYLLKLSRYVHQNPVCVSPWAKRPLPERIARLRKYRWSSYPGYIGEAKPHEFMDQRPVLAMMSGRAARRSQTYRQFVETGLATGDEEFQEAFRLPGSAIGDEGFRQWVEQLRGRRLAKGRKPEDVAFRRVVMPLNTSVVLSEAARVFGVEPEAFEQRRRHSDLRSVIARCLIQHAGCTQREAAELLGVGTGAAVSLQIKRLRQREKRNHKLAKIIRRLHNSLEKLQIETGTPALGLNDAPKKGLS